MSLSQLRAGFKSPPAAARLRCYWWWLNGNTDKATITHDLEEMSAKGFGGALLVDANGSDQEGNQGVPAGPRFGSAAWLELYTHALREADRLGLEITLNATSGWNLGGPNVRPQEASKRLTWARTVIDGGKPVTLPLPVPPSYKGFYRQIAVLAYPLHNGSALQAQPGAFTLAMKSAAAEAGFSMPNTAQMMQADPAMRPDTSLDEIKDISDQVDKGETLRWNPPAGQWEILCVGYTASGVPVSTSSGSWQGLSIDYLSRDAFDNFWNDTVAPLLKAAKPFHSLKYLAEDSWEIYEKGSNWTPTFADEFKRRRGYDPVPWLPVVAGRIVGNSDQSTRFLTDLRRTVADLVTANHYDEFARRAAEYGLGVQAESGGPHGLPIDALETFRYSAIPQTEFWSQNPHRSSDESRFFTKEAASAAHIYGQRLIAQESETSMGPQWSESLATDLKPAFDMAVTEGVNRVVWHEFTSSPASTGLPGQEYFAGTHINPKASWWNASPAFFAYLNRVQFMMQQGTPVDDLLYFYGDNIPNFVRLKADDPAHVLPGYDYDVTDEDALLRVLQIDAVTGTLENPSTHLRWHYLALPQTRRLSPAVLARVDLFLQSGGVVIGLPPVSPTGRLSTQEQRVFDENVRRIWGDTCDPRAERHYGRGGIFCTALSRPALQAAQFLPDVEVVSSGGIPRPTSSAAFDYVHRKVGGVDVYFVRNGTASAQEHDVLLRSRGPIVEVWDAVSGEMHRDAGVSQPDGRLKMHLALPSFGSAFVLVHGGSAVLPQVPSMPSLHRAHLQNTSWTITFQSDRGAPDVPVIVPALTSWTEWSQPGIRYFSGTATYRTTVQSPSVQPGQLVYLQLQDVREIARVRVNGNDAGTIWAQPYTARLDPYLTKGSNELEIEVTNLWPNRIIGDLQPNISRTYTKTNIRTYKADSPLLPSGLIGAPQWLISSEPER